MKSESEIRKEIEYRRETAHTAFRLAMAMPFGIDRTTRIGNAAGHADYADALLWVLGEPATTHDEMFKTDP